MCSVMAKIKIDSRNILRNEVIESLRDLFDSIDTDGSGEIDAAELSRAMKNIGMVNSLFAFASQHIHNILLSMKETTLDVAKQIIARFDIDGSGTIGVGEFVHIMTFG